MKDLTARELLEMSEWNLGPDVELGAAGEFTGVCMPQDFSAGQILNPNHARKLAAQLLREADLHDAIWEAGFEKGTQALEQQYATMRSALQMVRSVVNWRRDGGEKPSHREWGIAIHLLESLTTNPKEDS